MKGDAPLIATRYIAVRRLHEDAIEIYLFLSVLRVSVNLQPPNEGVILRRC